MLSANISPRAILKKPSLPSTAGSPRIALFRNKSTVGLEDDLKTPTSPTLADIIPSTLSGRVKLFNDLASPKYKHSNSKLSFKHLSNSISDIKALRDSQSPLQALKLEIKHDLPSAHHKSTASRH